MTYFSIVHNFNNVFTFTGLEIYVQIIIINNIEYIVSHVLYLVILPSLSDRIWIYEQEGGLTLGWRVSFLVLAGRCYTLNKKVWCIRTYCHSLWEVSTIRIWSLAQCHVTHPFLKHTHKFPVDISHPHQPYYKIPYHSHSLSQRMITSKERIRKDEKKLIGMDVWLITIHIP